MGPRDGLGDDICGRLIAAGCRSRMLMLTAAAATDDLVDGLGLPRTGVRYAGFRKPDPPGTRAATRISAEYRCKTEVQALYSYTILPHCTDLPS
jgi:hypothetical protein